jgi:hypothetical protein
MNFCSERNTFVRKSRICLMASLIAKRLVRQRVDFAHHAHVDQETRQAPSQVERKGGDLSALSSETHGDVSEAGLKRKRRRLLKLGARVRVSVRRIVVHLALGTASASASRTMRR